MQNSYKPPRKTSRGEVLSASLSTLSMSASSIAHESHADRSNPRNGQQDPPSTPDPGSNSHNSFQSSNTSQDQSKFERSTRKHRKSSRFSSPAAGSCTQQTSADSWSIGPLNREDGEQHKKSKKAATVQLSSWVYETSNRKLVLSEVLEKARWEQCDVGSSLHQEQDHDTWHQWTWF